MNGNQSTHDEHLWLLAAVTAICGCILFAIAFTHGPLTYALLGAFLVFWSLIAIDSTGDSA